MRSSTILSVILASSSVVSALPRGLNLDLSWLLPRNADVLRTGIAQCDLRNAELPQAPVALPPVSQGLVLGHVALGRGTQNYTCNTANPTEAPKPIGAVATLFNKTCASVQSPKLLAYLPRLALAMPVPASTRHNDQVDMMTSGFHDFINNTTPLFNLKTARHDFGFVAGAKAAASNAPDNAAKGRNGLGSVPWLKLNGIDGRYKEVYRVDTAGGVAPKDCQGQPATFQVEYAANYYFYEQA